MPLDNGKVDTDPPQSPASGRADRVDAAGRTAALLCAVALLWLATRPYFGAVSDGRFYIVEALHALDPGRFAEDLYFKFGSQGNFSLFTKIYLPLLGAFGVGTTAVILTIAGQLLWLIGLFRLARTLAGPRTMWLSITLVIGMMNIYAPLFGYGEAFATARLFAEGLTMLAMGLLPSRPFWTLAILGLSTAIHPLMTLPGIAVAYVYLALGRPIWWAAMAAGAGIAALLGLAAVEPFSNLFQTLDPDWFAVIKVRVIQCLITSWPMDSFVHVFGVLAWAIVALVAVAASHRRFLIATLVVGVAGVVCTYLGGDIAHNVLVVEVQSWRSMWLLQLVTRIYIPLVFLAILARTSLDSFRWATLLTIVLVLAASLTRLARLPNSAEFTPVSLILVTAALMVMATQLLLVEQKHRRIALVCALAGFALVPVALARWDGRSPWIRYLESSEPPPKDLAALLPAKASVYWENGLEMLWLRLRRPSYFSCDQGTGAVFYRETAMAYKHRAASFWPLRTDDFGQGKICASFDARPKPERNRKGLQRLCIREPELDYLVLTTPLDDVKMEGTWKSPVRFKDVQSSTVTFFARVTDRFYIYSCASVR